ncbi:hydroxymethylbilane synthase [Marinicauda salina]|uniref:Porphobilinogen deaminase n=1 Tax=Marinicauda salina TaxID=2135793 RepID=A0A2U2BVZ8_9PROT|nr:hydroxymethylbilane synthase [Marinicauda salina]PWE18196.1 hydroxymethylbilane synthase [Marinicauda salina]
MSPAPQPIATRTSPLALAQARLVQQRLAAVWDVADAEAAFPILGLTTTGDRITDRALLEAGGKGLFTKELERALMDGEASFAVHSMKDVPARLPDGLEIACVLEREDPRDVLLAAGDAARVADLPEGARLGTASIRRQAQAMHLRPDLEPVLLRGNVDTRLSKLAAGEVDATFLARAGLRRLGRDEAERPALAPEEMLPAPAQGAIGIEIRADDEAARQALAPLNDLPSAACVAAERAFLAALDGSCRTPIAAYATLDGATLFLRGEALTPDGSHKWADAARIALPEIETGAAARIGKRLGEQVAAAGGETLRRAIAESGGT